MGWTRVAQAPSSLPSPPPHRSRVREGGWGRGMTRAGAEGGREADTKPFPSPASSLPPPTAPPGRGVSPAPVRGARSPPSPETRGEGLREVRGGGSGDPTPWTCTLRPRRPPQQRRTPGRGSAGFRRRVLSPHAPLLRRRPGGSGNRGGCGVVWGRMGKGGTRE